eukprot:Gb_30044 [translate_table: standard]
MFLSHMCSRLSFPPLASCWPDRDHFNPHTSCSWPLYISIIESRIRTS